MKEEHIWDDGEELRRLCYETTYPCWNVIE